MGNKTATTNKTHLCLDKLEGNVESRQVLHFSHHLLILQIRRPLLHTHTHTHTHTATITPQPSEEHVKTHLLQFPESWCYLLVQNLGSKGNRAYKPHTGGVAVRRGVAGAPSPLLSRAVSCPFSRWSSELSCACSRTSWCQPPPLSWTGSGGGVMGTDTCLPFKRTHMVKALQRILPNLNTYNSSLEGATKLKFAAFCSP